MSISNPRAAQVDDRRSLRTVAVPLGGSCLGRTRVLCKSITVPACYLESTGPLVACRRPGALQVAQQTGIVGSPTSHLIGCHKMTATLREAAAQGPACKANRPTSGDRGCSLQNLAPAAACLLACQPVGLTARPTCRSAGRPLSGSAPL